LYDPAIDREPFATWYLKRWTKFLAKPEAAPKKPPKAKAPAKAKSAKLEPPQMPAKQDEPLGGLWAAARGRLN
jgi:hypothetical protein